MSNSDPPINLPPISAGLPSIQKLDQQNNSPSNGPHTYPEHQPIPYPPYHSNLSHNIPRPRLPSQPVNTLSAPSGITLPGVSSLASSFPPHLPPAHVVNAPASHGTPPTTAVHPQPTHSSPYPAHPPQLPPISSEPVPPSASTNAEPHGSVAARPLNVRDALSYLEQVKLQFGAQPEVYNRFLDIMKDFKSQEIDTPGVIERVTSLFRAQPNLIKGFNTFLPPGYNLEPTNNPNDPVRVTTPRDAYYQPSVPPSSFKGYQRQPSTSHQDQNPRREHFEPYNPPNSSTPNPAITSQMAGASNIITSMNQHVNESSRRSDPNPRPRGPAEFNHAISYVNKIKTRFSSQPEVYRQFLEILQNYQKDDKPIQEVYSQVQQLFGTAPDLLDEFKQFLPDNTAQVPGIKSASAPPPKKQARKPNTSAPPSHYYSQPAVQPLPPKKKVKTGKTEKLSTAEEMDFFEKCKKVIGNKTTYNEFLKILNLFTQEIIEAKVLIERVEPFLGKSPELFDWFKRFVKYDEDDIIYNIPAEKAAVDLRTCRQSGHSYRRLPNNIPRLSCSGRDELARDVLNDDWVSTPVFISESGFVSHKKTPHEEAMYKCEEERYEFDLNIEANLSVISFLEPIAKKIMLMPVEERSTFKLPPGLGGYSTTIYKRVIKKIYDNERGLEVIDALHHNPAIAVPIVLKRLKQKDEEWKRSQREWNKVWREIDAKNFSKALDHQGINFKVSDRKAISNKSLLNEIEVLQHEQKEKKSTLANRYQFDFSFKDSEMFSHVHQILLSCMENTPSISHQEDEKMKALLDDFIPKLFSLITVGNEELAQEEGSTMDIDTEVHVSKVVESDDMSTVHAEATITSLNIPVSQENVVKRSSYTLYANNHLYCFIRLYQMLYARLLRMKEISDDLSDIRTRSEIKNPVAVELGFRKENTIAFSEKDRFTELLKDINNFINNEMDFNEFEDKTRELFWTSGYLIFTVDKLVQSIIKQLQSIVSDPKSMELITIFGRDREKRTTGPRQEALYRLCAEQLIQDENVYRIEQFINEKVLTIQLLGKEDHVADDAITSEEKWSLYVDQFVQLSTIENPNIKRRDPFCKRNLPIQVGEEPPQNVETKSGLELKICVNTYKIFFVDNTEDYFRRSRNTKPKVQSNKVVAKFNDWLNSENGWKRGLSVEDIEKHIKSYNDLTKI